MNIAINLGNSLWRKLQDEQGVGTRNAVRVISIRVYTPAYWGLHERDLVSPVKQI